MQQVEDEQASSPSETGDGGRRRGVRRGLLVGATVVVIAGIGWFIYHQTRGRYYEETDDAYIQADAVTISPKVSGYVAQVMVRDNQDVKAGQPLVRIDPRDYDTQASESRAQISVAAANADNVRAMIQEQLATIDQARAQLAAADEDAGFATREVARYAPLAASGAETQEKLSTLRNQAAQASKQAAAQRAALEMAERRVGSLQAQVRQAQAQGQVAQAQLAAANVNVGSTVLRTSVAGRIGDKTVRVGQFVPAGTRLLSVVPVSSIYISANFKETQIGLMRPGQPATIHVDALSGVDLTGHVDSIAPGTGAQFSLIPPQNATGNFTKIVQRVPVRIAIDAGPEARRVLVPGLSVTVTVDTIGAKGETRAIAEQERARRKAGQ